MIERDKVITVRLTEEEHKQLAEEAKKQGLSQSDIVRQSLRSHSFTKLQYRLTMNKSGRTIRDRRKLWSELSNKFEAWMKLSDDELLAEAQKLFPGIKLSEVSRDMCFKILVMDWTDKMVGE